MFKMFQIRQKYQWVKTRVLPIFRKFLNMLNTTVEDAGTLKQ